MNKNLSIFLQVVVVLIGAAALIFLIWMPTVEGANVNSTLFEIYFKDPFLAFVYVGSIAFFVGVYKVFKVLGYAGKNELSSPAALTALSTIKYCALILIGFVLVGQVYIITSISDDRAGGIMMGNFIIFCSIVTAVAAGLVARKAKKKLTV